jgi:hypothetical protein
MIGGRTTPLRQDGSRHRANGQFLPGSEALGDPLVIATEFHIASSLAGAIGET